MEGSPPPLGPTPLRGGKQLVRTHQRPHHVPEGGEARVRGRPWPGGHFLDPQVSFWGPSAVTSPLSPGLAHTGVAQTRAGAGPGGAGQLRGSRSPPWAGLAPWVLRRWARAGCAWLPPSVHPGPGPCVQGNQKGSYSCRGSLVSHHHGTSKWTPATAPAGLLFLCFSLLVFTVACPDKFFPLLGKGTVPTVSSAASPCPARPLAHSRHSVDTRQMNERMRPVLLLPPTMCPLFQRESLI